LKIREIVTFASSLVIVLLMFASQALAQASAGVVSEVTGTVTIERAGASAPAAYGAAVQVGDMLTTGPKSRVTISLTDASKLELSESSTLALTENLLNPDGSRASTKVTLLSGLVRSLVHHGAGNPNFEVYTPNAVAAARGTVFDVSYHEGQAPPTTP
jgi:hypothetical protein